MKNVILTILSYLFFIGIASGQLTFEEVSQQWNITESEFSTGVAILDLDGDEINEILFVNVNTQSRLYKWNGSFYDEVSDIYGVQESDTHLNITVADVNKDRFPDFFISGDPDQSGRFYVNNGMPPLFEMSNEYNLRNTFGPGSAFFQMLSNGAITVLTGTQLMVLQGGTFVNIAEGSGFEGLENVRTPLFFDLDGDIDDDIFIAHNWECNDGSLFRNNGDGTFTDITYNTDEQGFGYGQGVTFGDIDNDGDFDLYLTSGFGENSMWANDGTGYFENITDYTNTGVGGYSRGAAFGDFNNDGYLDLFVNRGTATNILFMNNGLGSFYDYSEQAGVMDVYNGAGCAVGDLNNDGHLDIVAANLDYHRNLAYINQSEDTSFIKVKLVGQYRNTLALGAILKLYSFDDEQEVIVGMREISSLSSIYSVNELTAHFGTGNHEDLGLRVVFKSMAIVDTAGLRPGQTIVIYEPGVVSIDEPEPKLPYQTLIIDAYPNPFNNSIAINISNGSSDIYDLKIYNVLGRLVRKTQIRNTNPSSVKFIWNATDDYGQYVPSGLYFVNVVNGDDKTVKKVILLK
ncbi:MAG: T9SS type A sorting domain-containing protein [candidate division Zixibacteria bacterium]|nr:T9SS type A sorting domain-containing protein [candidate division Zixibacteria bacterium]